MNSGETFKPWSDSESYLMDSLPHPSETARWLRDRCPLQPQLAIVLGSGFNALARLFHASYRWNYQEIPGFLPSTVPGHPGELLIGSLGPLVTLLLSGRGHLYEGRSPQQVAFPVHVVKELNIPSILFTNAAGGISAHLQAGDFMVITDQINATGANPLIGSEPAQQERFIDMSHAYDPGLQRLLLESLDGAGCRSCQGVYLGVAGPSFETPAEIRAFASLGADAVGMSTVLEVIAARSRDLRVAGLSMITNLAAGRSGSGLSHREVLQTGREREKITLDILRRFVRSYPTAAELGPEDEGKAGQIG